MQTRRRERALHAGEINCARPLSHDQMMTWSRLYGYEADDFIADVVPASEVQKWSPDFDPITSDGRLITGTVVRWRLKHEALARTP